MKSTIWIKKDNEQFWVALENKSGWVNAIIEQLMESRMNEILMEAEWIRKNGGYDEYVKRLEEENLQDI